MRIDTPLQMGHARFQKFDSIDHAGKSIAHWIGNKVVFEIDAPIGSPPFARIPDDPSWNANHRHARRNILNNHGIRPNPGTGADNDWPQNFGASANQSIAFDGWMTLAGETSSFPRG
jgi:hypothetical protein